MSNEKNWQWESPLAEIIHNSGEVLETVTIGDSDIVNIINGDEKLSPFNVCDLSPLPRFGAKGDDWKNARELKPATVNKTRLAKNGEMVCTLAEDEILVLAAPDGACKLSPPKKAIAIPRRDGLCQIGLCGENAEDILARICAVAPPGENELIQTIAANIGAIIVREKRAPAFYILCDAAYAEYMWRTIAKMNQFITGKTIGWRAWRGVVGESAGG